MMRFFRVVVIGTVLPMEVAAEIAAGKSTSFPQPALLGC
jgi:hypothetical protein